MKTLLRFIAEDDAQDLLEYALLCAFVSTVGVLAWQGILAALRANYTAEDTQTQQAVGPRPSTVT